MENEKIISENNTTPVKKPKQDYMFAPKLIICFIGMFLGVFLLVNIMLGDDIFFGLGFFGYGKAIPSAEFGADFYTDVYKAVKFTGENVEILTNLVSDSAKIFGIMTGSGFTLGFGYKLFDLLGKHKEIMEG
ncbi:MAG: hypothetical protein J6I55_11200 [Ruminococcus sp.]|nr:hypothetical protein [Ruminococcus sp.]